MYRLIKQISVAIFYVLFILIATTALTRSSSDSTKDNGSTLDLLMRDIVELQIVTMARYEFVIDKSVPYSEKLKFLIQKTEFN
jgi:hypothetical protein